jgi:hypothetical protein
MSDQWMPPWMAQLPAPRDVPPDTPGAPDFSITNTPPLSTSAPPSAPSTAAQNLWLRTWNLTIGQPSAGITTGGANDRPAIGVGSDTSSTTQGGGTLNLSDFRILFQYEMSATNGGPWHCIMTVYNVPDELARQIVDQYTTVALTAGYSLPQPTQDSSVTISHDAQGLPVGERSDTQAVTLPQGYKPGGSLLFSGPVVWYERGRENATDTFLRIYAQSNDRALNLSLVNTTLPAGHTQKDVAQACVDAMAKVQPRSFLGWLTSGLEDTKSPRSRTLYGMPRDVLRDVAQSHGAFCHIDDTGKVNILKPGDPPPTPAIVINGTTGMIGIPKQNMDGGISVTTLLNPSIRPGTIVQINQGDVVQKQLSQSGQGLAQQIKDVEMQQIAMQRATDGLFQVWTVTHHGDTRGNPWYSDIITMATVPPAMKFGG